MKSQEEKVEYFKNIIPQRINVQLVKNDEINGIYVKVLDLPHCYTQVENSNELPEMVTDLVLTHFEVPTEIRKELGSYIPLSDKHLKLEEAFRSLIEIQSKTRAGEEVKQIFERAEAVAV